MSLTSIIVLILAIALIFLIIRIFMKTFKLVIAVVVIIIILGVWFYGYSGVFNKVSDNIPELGIQKIAMSITGCTTELDCAYVTNPGDCKMVKDYCNNVFKEDNYKKVLNDEALEEDCNKTSVEIDYNIDCDCKLHKEREGVIKQWLGKKLEEKAGYTYCWKKEP